MLGAVASNILPPAPLSSADLLQCYQYISFSNSMLLRWPAETAAGYLSVIPGQLSGVRWKAIAVEDKCAAKPANRDALGIYFKGLGPLSPHDSMLYLAEDRVLCLEIVSDPHIEWTITQIDDAVAITDPCHSWGELLRQRKRWCNGYIACRVNYIRKLPSFIANPAVKTHRKLRAVSASIYHAVLLANDWCRLAVFTLLLACLTQNSLTLLKSMPFAYEGLTILSGTAFCAILAQFILCYRGDLTPKTIRFFRLSVVVQAGAVMICLAINLLLGETILYASLLIFLYIVTPLASLLGHRRISKTIMKRMPIVFATMYVFPLLLWMYAICNVHDSSWGTKGLTQSTRNQEISHPTATLQANVFTRYRKFFVLLWAGSNLSLAGLAYFWSARKAYDPALIILSIASVLMLFGLACRAGTKLSWLQRFTRTNTGSQCAESVTTPLAKYSHQETRPRSAMKEN